MPNSQVLSEISKADIVVDELFSDTLLATFATESAFLGKPVITSGYYARHIDKDHEGIDLPPTIFVEPDQYKTQLKTLVDSVLTGNHVNTELPDWIKHNWSPKKVAQRILQVIDKKAPKQWFCDPTQIQYLYGWGLPEDQWHSTLAEYVAQNGEEGLKLPHQQHVSLISELLN